MKDVCDKRKVPRQALAYIIDSTGAPVCALIPFSTWVVFYSGVFIQEPDILNMGFSTGMSEMCIRDRSCPVQVFS